MRLPERVNSPLKIQSTRGRAIRSKIQPLGPAVSEIKLQSGLEEQSSRQTLTYTATMWPRVVAHLFQLPDNLQNNFILSKHFKGLQL